MVLNGFSKLALTCACACLCVALASCAPTQQAALEDAQMTPSAFMNQMNADVTELSQRIDEFSDAAERNDLAGMKAKAEYAFGSIDDMREAEAPQDLEDLKAKYMEAADALQNTLTDYISLYEEMATSEGAFDSDDFSDKMQSVQESYDKAVEALRSADELAQGM